MVDAVYVNWAAIASPIKVYELNGVKFRTC